MYRGHTAAARQQNMAHLMAQQQALLQSPQTAEWGPCLWRILHALAEKTGVKDVRMHSEEEKRCWLNLFNSLKGGMPCPLCRQHYRTYLMHNSIEDVFASKGEERRVKLRKWLWQFHNSVRTDKAQPVDVTLEKIQEMYTGYEIAQYTSDRGVLIEHMRRGMFQRWLIRDDMVRVTTSLDSLFATLF